MARKPLKPSKAARNQRRQEQRRMLQQVQLPSKQEAFHKLAQHLQLLPKG